MFFILIAMNFVFYISAGMSYYKDNMKMAVIYAGVALILSLLTLNYYRNQRKKIRLKKKDKKSSEAECMDCGGVDCFDMNVKDGWDCVDIECGRMECIEVDCGGVECGGADCSSRKSWRTSNQLLRTVTGLLSGMGLSVGIVEAVRWLV